MFQIKASFYLCIYLLLLVNLFISMNIKMKYIYIKFNE